MKKFLFIAASAALVLAACAKIENHQVTKETPVSFGVYAGKIPSTKAVSAAQFGNITTTELKLATAGFGVFGYYTGNDSYAPATHTANFMYNEKVTWDTDHWTYAPVKYWPNEHGANAVSSDSDKLTFLAYAPYVANLAIGAASSTVSDGAGTPAAATEGITAMTGNTATASASLTFSVPASKDQQIDLLYGVLKTQSVNVDGTSQGVVDGAIENLTKQKTTGTVDIIFRHALAKCAFDIKEVVDQVDPESSVNPSQGVDPNWTKVVVESLTLKGTNIGRQGDLNLYTGNWNVTTPLTAFAIAPLPSAISVDVAPTTYPAIAGVDEDGLASTIDVMLIPHYSDNGTPANPADDVFTTFTGIDIVYYVCTKDDNLATGVSVVKNHIDKDFETAINVQKGFQYNITVLLGLTSVKLTADVQAWDTDLNGDTLDNDAISIDLPQNVTPAP